MEITFPRFPDDFMVNGIVVVDLNLVNQIKKTT
jgi:hypothetical protein